MPLAASLAKASISVLFMGFCLSLTLDRVLVDKQLHKISYSLFLKVLLSIVISLIVWSIALGIFINVYYLSIGGNPSLNIVHTFLFISVLGFIIFGFIGAFFWTIVFLLINKFSLSEFNKHLIAAFCSTLITPLTTAIWIHDQDFDMLILIMPVVVVSLFFYRLMYLKTKA